MNKCPFNHGERPRDDVKAPRRIRMLPKDKRGFHVPWFVSWVKGEPEFRAADARKIGLAVKNRQCWVCGQKIGKSESFVFTIGPMCAVNRVSAEPPAHWECADYSVKVCPFLSMPQMKRRENNLPDGVTEAAGVSIRRNPGVILLWETASFGLDRVPGGFLFRIGDPIEVRWFREGREATRQEVLDSINSGLPILQDMADKDGPIARKLLSMQVDLAMKLVPV